MKYFTPIAIAIIFALVMSEANAQWTLIQGTGDNTDTNCYLDTNGNMMCT